MADLADKGVEDGCCTSSVKNMKLVLEQQLVTPCPNVVATVVHLTFPPGDIGSDPHTHPGPVIGYVLEGEFLFQSIGDGPKRMDPRIIKAGEAFYEHDGAVHVWSANASNDKFCKVVATVYGRPGEPLITYVKDYPRESREEAQKIANKSAK